MSSPPALVPAFAALPSDSLHHPPPAVHTTTPPASSLLQPPPHPDCSRCSVRTSLPAIIAATPSLLQLLSSCHPLPALVASSYCQRYGIVSVVVAMTPRCRSRETLISTSTLALTAFASRPCPLAQRRCGVHSHIAPNARRRRCCCCCHHLCVVVVIAALLPPLQLRS